MSRLRRSLATAFARACHQVLPAHRAPWAAAMQAELETIRSPDAALAFAAGCLWGAVKERTLTMDFAVRTTRLGTLAVLLALAVATGLSAARILSIHEPTALIFGVSSSVFATAAVWTIIRGPLALVQAASTMIVVYGLSLVYLQQADGAGWLNLDLYRALSLEGLLIWAVLLGGGMFMLKASPRAARQR